jgi:rod shape determining protein RodA
MGATRRAMAALDHLHRDPHKPTRHVDVVLVALVLGIAAYGVVMIYSAKRVALEAAGASTMTFALRQVVAIAIGLVGMVVIATVDYRRWREFAWHFFAGTTLLLVAVLVLGRNVNGAQAWFQLGPVQLQPSELAKVTLVLAIASFAAAGPAGREQPPDFRRFVLTLAIAGIPASLTLIQPDLGTAMVFGAITTGVLLVAGADLRHILVISLLGLVSVTVILGTDQLQEYQQRRLTAFLDDGSQWAWQQRNSQVAIGNGRITGEGLFEGSQTNLSFVPEQHTDFIFTATAEQLGFVGAAGLLCAHGLLAVRIWRTAVIARDLLGTLICVGVLAMLVFQVFQNIGMALGIMPITGIPLPLMSYGGSSTIAFFALVGLVQSVHMHRYQ